MYRHYIMEILFLLKPIYNVLENKYLEKSFLKMPCLIFMFYIFHHQYISSNNIMCLIQQKCHSFVLSSFTIEVEPTTVLPYMIYIDSTYFISSHNCLVTLLQFHSQSRNKTFLIQDFNRQQVPLKKVAYLTSWMSLTCLEFILIEPTPITLHALLPPKMHISTVIR